jgi:hypothetical protein
LKKDPAGAKALILIGNAFGTSKGGLIRNQFKMTHHSKSAAPAMGSKAVLEWVSSEADAPKCVFLKKTPPSNMKVTIW